MLFVRPTRALLPRACQWRQVLRQFRSSAATVMGLLEIPMRNHYIITYRVLLAAAHTTPPQAASHDWGIYAYFTPCYHRGRPFLGRLRDGYPRHDRPSGLRFEPPAAMRASTGLTCPTTPCTLQVDRKAEFIATFSKDGYESQDIMVQTRVAGGGAAGFAGNVLVGGLVGMGVDAATGATLEHYPNPVVASLAPWPHPRSTAGKSPPLLAGPSRRRLRRPHRPSIPKVESTFGIGSDAPLLAGASCGPEGPPQQERLAPHIRLHGWPTGWFERHGAVNRNRGDPFVRHCFTAIEPKAVAPGRASGRLPFGMINPGASDLHESVSYSRAWFGASWSPGNRGAHPICTEPAPRQRKFRPGRLAMTIGNDARQ